MFSENACLTKNRIRYVISLFCLLVFILMEKPSLYSKVSEILLSFSLFKLVAFVFVWIIFVVLCFCVAQSYFLIKWIFFFVFCFSTILFDIYYTVTGMDLQYDSLIMLFEARNNIFDAIYMYHEKILYEIFRNLFLLFSFIAMPPNILNKKKYSLLSLSIFGGMIFLVFYSSVFRDTGSTDKFPSSIRLYGLFCTYYFDYLTNPRKYEYALTKNKDLLQNDSLGYQNIILVVDESVRWDYSPFLRIKDYKKWFVYDYGMATSYANVSSNSNIALRKGVKFESLVDDFYSHPLIWSYAKEAGYRTLLYDNQHCGKGHDFFDEKELSLIDFNICDKVEDDAKIWEKLQNKINLNSNQRIFAIIIKKGSHFVYSRNFPKDYAFDKIVMDKYTEEKENRIDYLKSVIYQTDRFWNVFFNLKINKPTLIVYTSDHGQNLDDIPGLTHGTVGGTPFYGEGLVPLVVLSNVKEDVGLSDYNLRNTNRVSHFNIFPTIIEAMGFSPKMLNYHDRNSTLREETGLVGGFFYGTLFRRFQNKPTFFKVNYQDIKAQQHKCSLDGVLK